MQRASSSVLHFSGIHQLVPYLQSNSVIAASLFSHISPLLSSPSLAASSGLSSPVLITSCRLGNLFRSRTDNRLH